MIQVDWVAEFADLGMLQPLDEWLAREPKEFMDNIFPTFHKKWLGKQHYLPVHAGCVALFWNTEIFKKAGIAGPPKTWDEYVQMAKKLTNPEEKVFATTATLAVEPPTNLTYDIYPLIYQAGGDVIDEKSNKAVFNSPAGVKAVQWYVDLINVHKVAVPGVLSNGEQEKRGQLRRRQHRHDVRGAVGHPHPEEDEPEPRVRHRAPAEGRDHRDRRARLAQLGDHPGPEQGSGLEVHPVDVRARGQRDVGAGTGDFPARKDVAEKPFFKENKLAQAFVQQMLLPNAKSPILGMPQAVQMNKILTTEIQNVVQAQEDRQAGPRRRGRRVEQDPGQVPEVAQSLRSGGPSPSTAAGTGPRSHRRP